MTNDLEMGHQVSFHMEALVHNQVEVGIPDAYQGGLDDHLVAYQDDQDDVKTTVLVVLVGLELEQLLQRPRRLQLQHVVKLVLLLMFEEIGLLGVRPDQETRENLDDVHEIRDVRQVDLDVDHPLPMAVHNLEDILVAEENCLVRRDPDVSVHIHLVENDHRDFPYVHEGSYLTGNLVVHVLHLVLVRQMCLFLGHLVVPLHLEEFLNLNVFTCFKKFQKNFNAFVFSKKNFKKKILYLE